MRALYVSRERYQLSNGKRGFIVVIAEPQPSGRLSVTFPNDETGELSRDAFGMSFERFYRESMADSDWFICPSAVREYLQEPVS